MKYFAVITFILMATFSLSSSTQAQLRPSGSGTSSGPIAISADQLRADETGGLVTFTGAVVARQGEMTMTCDIMKVFYSNIPKKEVSTTKVAATSDPLAETLVTNAPQPEATEAQSKSTSPFDSSARQVDKVECDGNVKVTEGDRMAVGETAVYMANSLPRRIILTGDARVWQGRDSVTGHQVTYLLDQNISTVDGSRRSRVQTIFHQQDSK